MATTIRSTALDFENIKANLRTYIKAKPEFADYDFEASGLSNIMDLLAYNTHINGLVANFTLNESFLGTAQLRSSIVSLATGIGYIPDTKTASRGSVTISVNLSGVADRPSTITLPAFTRFSSSLDDIQYTFQTIEQYAAVDNGSGIYTFKTNDNSTSIPIYEGQKKTKTFIVGEYSEKDVYVIPDVNLDADTVSVEVYESFSSDQKTNYLNIVEATSVNENSTIYILKESPNEFFQLSFGANDILGRAPVAGNTIRVNYISTNGKEANNATGFTSVDTVQVGDVNYNLSVTTVSKSIGGDDKESIESIRRNAPFQYATQNRMVTPEDYTSIILRNYSTLIKDIKSWGGEDNPAPKFGTVFSSILFEDDVTETQINETKRAIEDLVKQLAIISFRVEFADPVETFVETDVFFQINPKLTPLSLNAVSLEVKSAIANYFSTTIGGFSQSFRRSNLLTLIDDISPAILSSRSDVKIQQRITPTIGALNNFNLTFPVNLRVPDDEAPVITSTNFVVQNTTCRIENKLGSNQLRIVDIGTGDIIVDNIGSYEPTLKRVNLVAFKPTSLLGGNDFIKISAIPANQSAISPTLNDILKYDEDASTISPVLTSAQN